MEFFTSELSPLVNGGKKERLVLAHPVTTRNSGCQGRLDYQETNISFKKVFR